MGRIGRMLLALAALSLPLVAFSAGTASAGDSQQTFSGTLSGISNTTFTVNCANSGGYVKGVGANKTKTWTSVPYSVKGNLNLNIVYVDVAKNTVPFAFLSRAVTSVDVTVQHVNPFGDTRWEADYACTSNINDAWRVLG